MTSNISMCSGSHTSNLYLFFTPLFLLMAQYYIKFIKMKITLKHLILATNTMSKLPI